MTGIDYQPPGKVGWYHSKEYDLFQSSVEISEVEIRDYYSFEVDYLIKKYLASSSIGFSGPSAFQINPLIYGDSNKWECEVSEYLFSIHCNIYKDVTKSQ